MTQQCTCALGADECTDDSGVFYPLQDGGMCATRPCQKKELIESLERDTATIRAFIQQLKDEQT